MKKIFKYFLYLIVFLLSIIIIYVFIAYIFTLFPKRVNTQQEKNKTIYILYSPIHTDIVLNINDINLSHFSEFKEKKYGYLAFGWGDKETYLNTPTINDFKLSTSFKAFFLNTPSLMHISYFDDISRFKNIKKLKLSTLQEKHLNHSIVESIFLHKKVYQGYGKEDFFYEAKEKYNFINTCNTWTGDKLRDSNITMPYWTPISYSIILN